MSGKVELPAASPPPPQPGTAGQPLHNESKPAPAPASVSAPTPAPAPAAPQTSQADLRLFIQEANAPGRYVYTVVDQRTGKVISQLPRDEVLQMKQHHDYAAGAVFDGKA